jgi:hypothetical protein
MAQVEEGSRVRMASQDKPGTIMSFVQTVAQGIYVDLDSCGMVATGAGNSFSPLGRNRKLVQPEGPYGVIRPRSPPIHV